MIWPDWDILASWLELMLAGLVVTLKLSFLTTVLTIILGSLSALGAVSTSRTVRIISRVYVDLFRSVPILALMIIFYFGFGPWLSDWGIDTFTLALAALSLSSGAYLSEVYRGAIQSVPRSQWRAAESLGLGHFAILRFAVIPQVIPPLVPLTLNAVISIVKNSSLASLITVNELTLSGTMAVSLSFMPMQVYLLLGAMYAAIILPLIFAAGRLERWVNRRYGLVSARLKPTMAMRTYASAAALGRKDR
jgi:His/Glu/Gln/Arg/opine family amino acid ABC transporter permease subunit